MSISMVKTEKKDKWVYVAAHKLAEMLHIHEHDHSKSWSSNCGLLIHDYTVVCKEKRREFYSVYQICTKCQRIKDGRK